MSDSSFKVVGVGGSGCAAAERMIGCSGCDFIAVNTDAKSLLDSRVPNKVLLGLNVTKGRSTGNNIRLGEEAALADRDKIRAALEGAKMTFLMAGLGGGTGAGAAPVVAEAAKSIGSCVVAFANIPFAAEGRVCRSNAQYGVEHLAPYCDLLILVQNDRFMRMVPDMSIRDAFTKVNDMLLEAVRGMVKLTLESGVENLKPLLRGFGSIGYGVGPTLAKATEAAMASPLVGADLKEASAAMLNFTTHAPEVEGLQEALDAVSSRVAPQAGIIWTNTVEAGAEAVEVLAVFSGVKPPVWPI
jgi:cell division protein FtsZ